MSRRRGYTSSKPATALRPPPAGPAPGAEPPPNPDVAAAAFRVRDFIESRAEFRKRFKDGHGHKFMTPDTITAQYGELHMADLWLLCEAVDGRSDGRSGSDG